MSEPWRIDVARCLAGALLVSGAVGCGAGPSPIGPSSDAGIATHDAGLGENEDAGAPQDSGADAGEDAGEDAGIGWDAGVPEDAGVDAGHPKSFASDVQPIFDARCLGCHSDQLDGGPGEGGLELDAAQSWSELVDVSATWPTCSSLKRIAPGSAMTSILYLKVAGLQGMCGDSMPKGSTLPAAEAQAVRDWISRGAPND